MSPVVLHKSCSLGRQGLEQRPKVTRSIDRTLGQMNERGAAEVLALNDERREHETYQAGVMTHC